MLKEAKYHSSYREIELREHYQYSTLLRTQTKYLECYLCRHKNSPP